MTHLGASVQVLTGLAIMVFSSNPKVVERARGGLGIPDAGIILLIGLAYTAFGIVLVVGAMSARSGSRAGRTVLTVCAVLGIIGEFTNRADVSSGIVGAMWITVAARLFYTPVANDWYPSTRATS